MSETIAISPTSYPPVPVPDQGGLPPIAKILPYITAVLSSIYPYLVLFFRLLYTALAKLSSYISLISPLPLVLYVCAPVTVFCQIAFCFLVLAPYRVLVYLIEAVYPLYVFCGVAVITGSLLGICARGISFVIVQWTDLPPPGQKKIKEEEEEEIEVKVET